MYSKESYIYVQLNPNITTTLLIIKHNMKFYENPTNPQIYDKLLKRKCILYYTIICNINQILTINNEIEYDAHENQNNKHK